MVAVGNRLDDLLEASRAMERFFMTEASVEDRAAMHTWHDSIDPRPTVTVVPGGHDSGSSISSSLPGSSDGETGPNVAAQPAIVGAGNQGPTCVVPAPAAAQVRNHDGAPPAVAKGGNDEGERESTSLDYSMTTATTQESTGTASGIQEPTGSASGPTVDGIDVLDDNNVESEGGTIDNPTGSGIM